LETQSVKTITPVQIRLLNTTDAEALFLYLGLLSAESRSRFGPHPFDRETINNICLHPQNDVIRYVSEHENRIIAYMLIQKEMIEADRRRYMEKNIVFNESTTATYAPSVADDFQNSGIGSGMFEYILTDLKNSGYKTIVLWGGVQATNARAVRFYEKHGFRHMGSFWHDGKDNYDMIKEL
jgi:diamine N-acetyltransferase